MVKQIQKPKFKVLIQDDGDEEINEKQTDSLQSLDSYDRKIIKQRKKQEKKLLKKQTKDEKQNQDIQNENLSDSLQSLDSYDREIIKQRKKKEKKLQNQQINDKQQNINIQKDKQKKKKKRNELLENNSQQENNLVQDKKIYLKSISIVIPDSIIQIAQSAELRSYFISQIARIAAIYCIDEIIVIKDYTYKTKSPNFDSTSYVCRNLQYLETPQYLRKALFPIHPDLKYTGLMNPIEARHHLKFDEFLEYREGVVINRPVKQNEGSWADIGLKKQCKLDYQLQPNTRVTIKLQENQLEIQEKHFNGKAVSQSEPMEKLGIYWGYQVRIAQHMNEVFRNSYFQEEYDFKICIGKRGKKVDIEELKNIVQVKRILLVFGGHEGIEPVVEGDEKSKIREETLHQDFDMYYCLNDDLYGVKSLRVEEEIQIFLQIINQIYCRTQK